MLLSSLINKVEETLYSGTVYLLIKKPRKIKKVYTTILIQIIVQTIKDLNINFCENLSDNKNLIVKKHRQEIFGLLVKAILVELITLQLQI